MAIDFWIVDTFSEEMLCGSPSAVLFVDTFEDEALLQNIAMELNTPETAFVKKFGQENFEVLCFSPNSKGLHFGNGLFAAAHIISSQKKTDKDIFNLILGDRIFEVQILDKDTIKIRFSSHTIHKISMPSYISSALDGEIVVSVAESKGYLIVEVRSPKKIANLNPNTDILSHLEHDVVIITADSHFEPDVDYDFCARVFAPKIGVVEDNITPIAHLKLASYWAERMEKNNMNGYQASKRAGYVNVEYNENYTYITGKNLIASHGVLFL